MDVVGGLMVICAVSSHCVVYSEIFNSFGYDLQRGNTENRSRACIELDRDKVCSSFTSTNVDQTIVPKSLE